MANYDRIIDGKKFTEFQFWLVFTNSAAMPRLTVRDPSLKREERAMFMSVLIPVSLWNTPQLKALVTVGDPGVHSITIDTEAAAFALREAIGMDVEVRVVDQERQAGEDT